MDSYTHRIVLDKGNSGHAYMSGSIDDAEFYVVIHKKPFAHALNFDTYDRGLGYIERLLIYSEDSDFEGNPFTPSMTVKRNVYAEFHDGWIIFNPNYESFVHDLVTYFKVRDTIHSV